MAVFTMIAKEFKKMLDPNTNSSHIKYVCYIQASSIPKGLQYWMNTNPRDRNMDTNVAKSIRKSLAEHEDFHELNRGILFSAKDVKYDNRSHAVEVTMTDNSIHGNIDGGHTLFTIFKAQEGDALPDERYVFVEFIVGLESPVDLAAARNTSVQVDLKSQEELRKSFDVIKNALHGMPFEGRIAYKMNQHNGEDPIDVREIITILNMFNQKIYPVNTAGDAQPIQSYTGKEMSLKKFLNLGKEEREECIRKMEPVITDIFRLWDRVECEFADKAKAAKKMYGRKKYSKYDDGEIVGYSMFEQNELYYLVPKGLLYPLIGSFRALIEVDPYSGEYGWKKNPFAAWQQIGPKLVTMLLEEKEENPEYIGKSKNLWSNLYKEVLLYSLGIAG